MEIDTILALTIAGISLGIVEGIKPGPLLTMVIKETLSNGLKAGFWTATAPIFTDGPLIIISLLAANWFSSRPVFLALISLIGSIFLIKMGVECFSIEPPNAQLNNINHTKSLKLGILTNLLNPNVYIFWFLIGGPLMASVAEKEPIAPVAYAISFLISIILVKTTIAYFFDKTRGNISIKTYKLFLNICGVTMIVFAFGFINQAVQIYYN